MADPEKQPEQPKAVPEKQVIGKDFVTYLPVVSSSRRSMGRTCRRGLTAYRPHRSRRHDEPIGSL